jgi:hypothetical protein
MPSFTIRASGRLIELISPCRIGPAFDPASPVHTHPELGDFQAVWDTGATNSVISEWVVAECSLRPIGIARVYNANAVHDCEVYLVNMMLPNGIGFAAHRVTKQRLVGADALIGMDIIGGGDFAVTNKDGKTVFSFRFPAAGHIDFVEDEKGLAG